MVRLRVTDDRGAITTASGLVRVVADVAPVAAFAFAPSAPAVGEAVLFSSQSRDPDGVVVAQAWDLDGDGAFDDATGATAVPGVLVAGNVADVRAQVIVAAAARVMPPAVAAVTPTE